MEWTQVLSMIGTVIIAAYYIHRDIHSEIQEIRKEAQADRQQNQIEMHQANMRTDKLYQMFIDLLKEGKKHDA